MSHRRRYLPAVKFETTIEREDVRMGTYLGWVTYEIRAEADIDPEEGDGWNDPHFDAAASVSAHAEVISVVIGYEDGEEDPDELEGPPPCRVVLPGSLLKLTEKECESLEEEALAEACCSPDPDDQYDMMQELRGC